MARMSPKDWEEIGPYLEAIGEAFNESLILNEKLSEALNDLKNMGYDAVPFLDFTISINKRDRPEPAYKPLVIDGEVRHRTFTREDRRLLRSLNISLNPPTDSGE